MIFINFLPAYNDDDDDDRDEARIPDWEILTRILPYLRKRLLTGGLRWRLKKSKV
jgi:hypothetical protein